MRLELATGTLLLAGLSVLAPATAQSAVASAAVASVTVGASVALVNDPSTKAYVRHSSAAAVASLQRAGTLVVVSVSVVGEVATIILHDAAIFTLYSVTLPARILNGGSFATGTDVRPVSTEAGVALDRDGRLLAFVPNDGSSHLVHSDAAR